MDYWTKVEIKICLIGSLFGGVLLAIVMMSLLTSKSIDINGSNKTKSHNELICKKEAVPLGATDLPTFS